MSIEETNKIDFATINHASGKLWLTISDHLSWDSDGQHLFLLQEKLNNYLKFIESGEIFDKIPDAQGRDVVINVIGKFPLSENAKVFLIKAKGAIENAGLQLQFTAMRPDEFILEY